MTPLPTALRIGAVRRLRASSRRYFRSISLPVDQRPHVFKLGAFDDPGRAGVSGGVDGHLAPHVAHLDGDPGVASDSFDLPAVREGGEGDLAVSEIGCPDQDMPRLSSVGVGGEPYVPGVADVHWVPRGTGQACHFRNTIEIRVGIEEWRFSLWPVSAPSFLTQLLVGVRYCPWMHEE